MSRILLLIAICATVAVAARAVRRQVQKDRQLQAKTERRNQLRGPQL